MSEDFFCGECGVKFDKHHPYRIDYQLPHYKKINLESYPVGFRDRMERKMLKEAATPPLCVDCDLSKHESELSELPGWLREAEPALPE